MGQTERLYQIEALLRARRVVSSRSLREECGVTRATLNRDLALRRDRLNAPIVHDRNLGGYRLGDPKSGEARHELPGLWFSSREVHALLTFHHFLEHLEPGLLSPHIAPRKERIQSLLEGKDQTPGEIRRRIRILAQATRKRLRFQYHGRGRDDITERRTSPQRLVHYRDNWYLDAWDHGKRALRTFAVERIRAPQTLDQRAKDVPAG